MRILLCSATPFEIQPTIDYLNQNKIQDVEVLITGVGLTTATYSLTKKIISNRPHLVIQAGIAGSFDETIQLGETVAVQTEMFGDFGVMEEGSFKSVFDLRLINKDEKPWSNGTLVNKNDALLSFTGLPVVNAVTVQEITTDEDRNRYYKNSLGAQVETMEGAALHYVALTENVHFLQLRSVSNFVGERNKKNWDIQKAIAGLNKELLQIITNF